MTLQELMSALSSSNPYREDIKNVSNNPIVKEMLRRVDVNAPAPVLAMEADTPPPAAPYIDQGPDQKDLYTKPSWYRGPITGGPPNTPEELALRNVSLGPNELTPEELAQYISIYGRPPPGQRQGMSPVAQATSQMPRVDVNAPAPVLAMEANTQAPAVAASAPENSQTTEEALPVALTRKMAAETVPPSVPQAMAQVSPPPALTQAMTRDNNPPQPKPVILDSVKNRLNQGQGILSKVGGYLNSQFRFTDPDFLQRLGNGLSVAGSQDPFKALMMLRAQQGENEKIRLARIKAAQPIREQISGTPITLIRDPITGQVTEEFNPVLAKFFKDKGESTLASKIEMAVTTDRLNRGRDDEKERAAQDKARLEADLTSKRDAEKAASKAAEEAIPVLNDVQGLSERWKEALKLVSTQGKGSQLQGIPFISGIAGFFGGDEVAKNKFLEGLTVDETLLNTARTKGAISNQEMSLFKSPIPSVTDDREKVWKPWINKRLKVLSKLEEFYEGQAARSPSASGASSAAPAAAPASPAVPLSDRAQKYFN